MRSTTRHGRFPVPAILGILIFLGAGLPASAQVTPAAGSTPPDDTPSVKVGGTIFADYTYFAEPEIKDDLGNPIHYSGFNVGRAYINVTGNLSHLISYRITPDIARDENSDGTPKLEYRFRLKYAYAQLNLDDWLPKGGFVRLGMQPTPYVDYADGIYRYRFQGQNLFDREKLLSSSDSALSARFAFPGNYGDVHFGLYNGEGYSKPEVNNQKAFHIRASVRPLPMTPVAKGLRLTLFYDDDAYANDAKRDRWVTLATFEYEWVNAGIEYGEANDELIVSNPEPPPTKIIAPEVEQKLWSAYATPRLGKGFELLLKYAEIKPDTSTDKKKTRTTFGVSYWLPVQKGVSCAVLLDYEGTKYANYASSQLDDKRYALHTLFSF